MKVVSCKVGEPAEVIEIDGSLASMQELVKGSIETCPYEGIQNIVYVLNNRGKCDELPVNKAIYGGLDFIVGDFFVAAIVEIPDVGRDVGSLSEEQLHLVINTVERGRVIYE